MNVYIHRRAKFFCPEQPLTRPQFGIGYTLQDYYRGYFVELNTEQQQYYFTHPGCSPIEAFTLGQPLEEPGEVTSGSLEVSGSLTSGSLE